MDILEKLFSSGTIVRMMRVFLFHPEVPFDKDDLVKKTRSRPVDVAYEIKVLKDARFLKPRVFSKTVTSKKGKKEVIRKKKVQGWMLNDKFPYTEQLSQLLVSTTLVTDAEIEKYLKNVGVLKLVVLSGTFMYETDARLDILIIVKGLKKRVLRAAMQKLEGAIGTEVAYAVFDPEEFEYRLSVRDRLIRDVFERSHRIILNKLPQVDLSE